MLRHLRVQNFALLSDVEIEFGTGFHVLTGETGAGKSLIVEAVNLLRGGRASADIPRTGESQAVVEALFESPGEAVRAPLEEAGLPDLGDELVIRRIIQRGGRSRVYINGALTTATRLAEIGQFLVDLSGQHQHQGLVDSKNHRRFLDALMDEDELLATMAERFAGVRELRQRRDALTGDERNRDQRIDFLRFQVSEIDEAELIAGEDLTLDRERQKLGSASNLEQAARTAEGLVYGNEGAAVDQLAEAIRTLDHVATHDPDLGAIASELRDAEAVMADAGVALQRYADTIDGDERRLAEVETRLDTIARLCRKHGSDLNAVLTIRDELAAELSTLDSRDDQLESITTELAHAEERAVTLAARITRARSKAIKKLEREVGKALSHLGMGSAKLKVQRSEADLSATGGDKIEFLLSANKGETAKPLVKVASGGELSRIMLAMKLVLRRADDVDTYVFDEVDTGIGGETAVAVGAKIRQVADTRQVLCVSHLPQIAAFADVHLHVEKFEEGGRTETKVRTLSDKDRRREMARMLGGKTVSKAALAHADELIKAAAKERSPAR